MESKDRSEDWVLERHGTAFGLFSMDTTIFAGI